MRFFRNHTNQRTSALTLGILLFTFTSQNLTSWAEEQKPKYGPDAVPLSASSAYFKDHFPPLFWKIIPYYIHQQNEWSCNIVSSIMIMNAARSILKMTPKLKADQPLIYESDFIELMKKQKDLARYYGDFSRKGAALPELGDVLNASLKVYGIRKNQIEVVQFTQDAQLPDKEKHLHDLLAQLEKSDRHLIIANFNQGVFTGDADVGHYSPIAAYDSKNKKVLILDTDRKWYEPYWVSESILIKGMKTTDTSTNKGRGYIHLELPAD